MPDFTDEKPTSNNVRPENGETLTDEHEIEKASGFADPDTPPDPEEFIEKNEGTVVEEVAEQLHVDLPEVALPLPMKIIALVTLVGGLGILGSSLTGIFVPARGTFQSYILNLVSGVIFLAIAYGLYQKQNWSTWLYGAIVLIGLFINPAFSIVPALIVIYMIMNRRYLYASFLDRLFHKLSKSISDNLKQ